MAKTPRGSRKKVTSSHSTAIPMAERLLKFLNRWEEVTKVSLGLIKPLRNAPRRIKVTALNPKVLLVQTRGAARKEG